jgi:hydroxymethylbilane synthase
LTRRSIDGALLAAEDVPLDVPPDLTLAAVLPRGPVEDALITRAARTLQQLPLKARVLTSGARRRAALLQARPDLTLIERRVSLPDTPALLNAEDVDAAVVPSSDTAGASLSGFGLQLLPATVFTPAAGQGAFVIVARADDEIRLTTFATLDDADARLLICAERAVMKALGAAASAPVGVLAQLRGRRLEMSGKVWSPDGRDCAGATIAGDVLEDSRLALELAYELSLRGAASLLALDKLHRAA